MIAVEAFAWVGGELQRRKVVQCALSRVCGVCGRSLGRPIAFLGDGEEVARNAFHLPPMHASCAEDVASSLGLRHHRVLVAGYEFVRPGRDDLDPEPRFTPHLLR